ncbi:hypothetical protein MMC12_000258 [Toensbergia leucococca]|nr:hypothetical protein [Toensbergia leucococca]
MFNFQSDDLPKSKCYLSHGTLPQFIDPSQPPSKKKPFATVLSQSFTHTLDLVLPEELYELIWKDVESEVGLVRYSRVIMPLSVLLEGDFFSSYIKTGNIMMLSQGRPGVNDLFYLKDDTIRHRLRARNIVAGILRLELAKESYERCGLIGKPIRDGGRKHLKTRYAVEINLRLPSMLHGKKGFERIVWAFKNVLNHSMTWLFHDLQDTHAVAAVQLTDMPITKHHPTFKMCHPQIHRMEAVVTPALDASALGASSSELSDWATEVYEWLSLIALQSPRVQSGDAIDPYLCRYSVPENSSTAIANNFMILRWTGLIPSFWIRKLFIACIKKLIKFFMRTISLACRSRNVSVGLDWFTLSSSAFRTEVANAQEGYTILRLPTNEPTGHLPEDTSGETGGVSDTKFPPEEYVLWEMADSCDGRV